MQIELKLFYSRLGAIALILVLGFLLGKLKLISHNTNKQLANLLLVVFMPAALFSAFPAKYDPDTASLFFSGMLGGVVVMLLLVIVAKLFFANRLFNKGDLSREAQFGLIFNNATFLGYPIVINTFGERGVIAYCGFIIIFKLALFSYGVFLFQRKITTKLLTDVITNPNIVAVILGMIFFLLNVQLPRFANDAVSFVGAATTPLSIICVGYMLSRAKFTKLIKSWRLGLVAIAQLICGPVITYFALLWLGMPGEVIAVCTLIQALPTATSLALFASKYDGNEVEASELVTISTTFSIITMPLMVTLLLG